MTSVQAVTSQQEQGLLLKKTVSACSKCAQIADSNVVIRNGRVLLEKECCQKDVGLLENDVEYYKLLERYHKLFDRKTGLVPGQSIFDPEVKQKLIDEANTIHVTVNMKCNLKCPICYQKIDTEQLDVPNEDFSVSVDKIKEILKGQTGKLVAIIGGEPTLRDDLFEILRCVKDSGNTSYLATNGLALLNKNYAKQLKENGLGYVNLWFDSFNDEVYMKLRGGRFLNSRLQILKNLKEEGMNVWLNAIIARGVNDSEIPQIIKFAMKNKNFIRGVSFLCLYTGSKITPESATTSDILKVLDRSFGITYEYWIENKIFRNGIYQLIRNLFGKKFAQRFSSLRAEDVLLTEREGKIGSYIPLGDLKKFNEQFEKVVQKEGMSKILSSLFLLSKVCMNPMMFPIAKSFVRNNFNLTKTSSNYSSTGIRVYIGHISSLLNTDYDLYSYTEEGSTFTNRKSEE